MNNLQMNKSDLQKAYLDRTLDERCAEVYALDAKRTQGEWSEDVCVGLWGDGHAIAMRDGKLPASVVAEAIFRGQTSCDGKFIAAATKMPALIRDLQARVKELEESNVSLQRLIFLKKEPPH